MKISMKLGLLFFFAAFIIVSFRQGPVYAKDRVRTILYGSSIQGEHSPVIKNGSVLAPFKDIFNSLGFTVTFDSASKTITGSKSGTIIKFLINQNTAWINNTPFTLQVPPQIINGTTYVPLRFIGEASGLEVKWYGQSQIVSLYSKENLFSVMNGGKFGYINAQGKVVIDYQEKFSDAYAFKEGLAIVQSGGKFAGFINQQGKIVIPKGAYYDAKSFSEGLAAYRTVIISTSPDSVISKYGYMDITGTSVIKPKYTRASDFSEGLAAVQIGSKFGFIDPSGNLVIKAQYDSAMDFSEGLALVKIKDAFSFIDKKGKAVIEVAYSQVESFSEDLSVVKKNSKYGYINKTGKLVIPAIYEAANSFSEGLGAVRLNGKQGYVDKKGELQIFSQVDKSSNFMGGLAVAESGGKTGFINKRGEWVIQPTLAWANPFFMDYHMHLLMTGKFILIKAGKLYGEDDILKIVKKLRGV